MIPLGFAFWGGKKSKTAISRQPHAPIVVQASMGVGVRIIDAAGLSFLGLGVQPPTPEWGAMLTAGRTYIRSAPYLTIIPGLCIMVVVLSLNLLGDGLRDAMDPKLKK